MFPANSATVKFSRHDSLYIMAHFKRKEETRKSRLLDVEPSLRYYHVTNSSNGEVACQPISNVNPGQINWAQTERTKRRRFDDHPSGGTQFISVHSLGFQRQFPCFQVGRPRNFEHNVGRLGSCADGQTCCLGHPL